METLGFTGACPVARVLLQQGGSASRCERATRPSTSSCAKWPSAMKKKRLHACIFMPRHVDGVCVRISVFACMHASLYDMCVRVCDVMCVFTCVMRACVQIHFFVGVPCRVRIRVRARLRCRALPLPPQSSPQCYDPHAWITLQACNTSLVYFHRIERSTVERRKKNRPPRGARPS